MLRVRVPNIQHMVCGGPPAARCTREVLAEVGAQLLQGLRGKDECICGHGCKTIRSRVCQHRCVAEIAGPPHSPEDKDRGPSDAQGTTGGWLALPQSSGRHMHVASTGRAAGWDLGSMSASRAHLALTLVWQLHRTPRRAFLRRQAQLHPPRHPWAWGRGRPGRHPCSHAGACAGRDGSGGAVSHHCLDGEGLRLAGWRTACLGTA